MKKISWRFIIIGSINILLSILNTQAVLFSLKSVNDAIRLILPFQGTELSFAAIYQIFPKLLPIVKNIISPLVGYAISLTLFISGLGVILRKSWGKIFACIYAISMVTISIIGFPIVLAEFIKEFAHIEKYGFFEGLIWGGALAYILALIGTLLYPIILLIFFSRSKIKEQRDYRHFPT